MSKDVLIVIDFLSQKYEIEYEDDMSAQDVIRKVQKDLFPSEQSEDLILQPNEKSCHKLCLYQTELPTSTVFKGPKLVTWNIKRDEIDYRKYLFFIFRPIMNIFLSIYIVFPEKKEKDQCIGYFDLIYPIKKKVIVLKNYLKNMLLQYTSNKGPFRSRPINGFKLEFIQLENEQSPELRDEFYIEQWMNGKEMYLIVDPKYVVNHNSCSLGRFYYLYYGSISKEKEKESQKDGVLTKDGDSLDFEEKIGIDLSEAKKKLIEKYQSIINYPDEKVVIIFNGVVQTNKFYRLDDLFSDNDFYRFVVIFELDVNKFVSQIPQGTSGVIHELYVPEEVRPNILNLRFSEEEPKKERRQRSLTSISQPSEPILSGNGFDDDDDDFNFVHYEQNFHIQIDNENIDAAQINNNTNIDNNENENNIDNKNDVDVKEFQTTEENVLKDENSNVFIEEEEEDLDDDVQNNQNEYLLDMFCYYFVEFSKEKHIFDNQTPYPTYFNSNNLTSEEANLINVFKKYYRLYRDSNY